MEAFVARHGDEGAAWVARLPALIDAYSARWSVTVTASLPGSGSAAWVGAARTADGTDVVLKIGWPHLEAETEAAGLRFFDGHGAVRLLAADESEFALLLERCTPGEDLWSLDSFREADEAAASVLERLWRPAAGADELGIGTLAGTVEAWNAEFSYDRSDYPPALVADAAAWGVRLAASANDVVVHGDFNPFNVLSATREPWLAIDPKPLIGDPAYDLAQYLANWMDHEDSLDDAKAWFDARIRYFARRLSLDRQRIASWLFVKSIGWSWGPRAASLFREVAASD